MNNKELDNISKEKICKYPSCSDMRKKLFYFLIFISVIIGITFLIF